MSESNDSVQTKLVEIGGFQLQHGLDSLLTDILSSFGEFLILVLEFMSETSLD